MLILTADVIKKIQCKLFREALTAANSIRYGYECMVDDYSTLFNLYTILKDDSCGLDGCDLNIPNLPDIYICDRGINVSTCSIGIIETTTTPNCGVINITEL